MIKEPGCRAEAQGAGREIAAWSWFSLEFEGTPHWVVESKAMIDDLIKLGRSSYPGDQFVPLDQRLAGSAKRVDLGIKVLR